MRRFLSILGVFLLAFVIGYRAGNNHGFPYRQIQFLNIGFASLLNQVRPDPSFVRTSLLHVDALPPQKRIKRTAIINTLLERYGYHSYLEIGQGPRSSNYDFIECQVRIGVDPDKSLDANYKLTSDEFFAINHDSYDLIFIDGLHIREQVERDINNSLKVLKENGTIVMHDCNPIDEEWQIVPEAPGRRFWTGDVWKAWATFRASRPDLKMCVVDVDFGCGIIRRGNQQVISLPDNLSYEFLDKNRQRVLNLVDLKSFLEDLKRVSSRE